MNTSIFRKIPNYYVVSILSVIVNLGIYVFLVAQGVNYIPAVTVGFVAETIIAYLLNRFWTFSNTKIDFKVGYMRSFLVAIFNLILILTLTVAGVEILKYDYLVARIIAGIIVGILSFLLDAKFSYAVWSKK